jgi:hypothetical protein
MSVFHCTIDENVRSILLEGINPLKATTLKKVSWYCTIGKVAWAIHHVAKRHGWNPAHVQIIVANLHEDALFPTQWPGVYKLHCVLDPRSLRVLPDEWADLLFRKPSLNTEYLRTL